MTVKELLRVYNDKRYTNVVILEEVYNEEYHDYDYEVIATWNVKDYWDDYYGQLNYFTRFHNDNELIDHYKDEVKNFWVCNPVNLDVNGTIYIEVK